MSLRRLGVDTIDLFQLHRIDDKFPLEDQVGELVKLQNEGKIRHIGLSEINVDQLHAAQKIAQIVSVQNMYNLTTRSAEALLDESTKQGIGFIPWFPLAAGPLAAPDGPLAKHRRRARHATPSQLALAWLLKRSPVDAADPGDLERRPSGGERRRRRDRTHRRRVRDTEQRLRASGELSTKERFARCGNTVFGWHPEDAWHPGGGFNPPEPRPRAGPTTADSSTPCARCRITPGPSTRPTK